MNGVYCENSVRIIDLFKNGFTNTGYEDLFYITGVSARAGVDIKGVVC